MNGIEVQAIYEKIKSEETNLAIPGEKSYLQESILHLQQIHGRGKKPTTTKRPCTVSYSRQGQQAHDVSL